MSCNKQKQNNFTIDVNITNLVLTPLTCASLVSKVIKCLVYEKSQIPYPYEWLKTIVDKKRKLDATAENETTNYQAERHFRLVSSAYDTTESLMYQIKNQFKTGGYVEEILLLFGGSEMNPKEVYRIKFPNLATTHVESNHISSTDKWSHTVLRKIFLSEEWMSAMDNTLAPTNMFTFIKTNGGNVDSLDFFIPNSSFYFPKKSLIVNINLTYHENLSHNCCNNLTVFQDGDVAQSAVEERCSEHMLSAESDNNENIELDWYQANIVFKGFKESFVNKVPLSQLW